MEAQGGQVPVDETEPLASGDVDVEDGGDLVVGNDDNDNAAANMKDSTASAKLLGWYDEIIKPSNKGNFEMAGYQKLVTDKNVQAWSINVLRFGIFADAITSTILQPNYAIMARPGADPDSFPSTGPFAPNSATYFIPMCALLGVALSSAIAGNLSDKLGRKPVLLVCMGGSVVGTALKFFLRASFWGFCAANFANGLFSGGLPVALAYVGDIFTDAKAKDGEFGIIVGCYVLGNSIGGMVAILMNSTGLFTPLWVGVGLEVMGFILIFLFLVEPGALKLLAINSSENELEDEDDEDDIPIPTEINQKVMWNIIVGAFTDNVGSNGLFPLCLAPLAFDQFYNDFASAVPPQEPVLSLTGYKWASVMVALTVIPSTLFTPVVFNKLGAAGGCVMGNICTAILTVVLLFLGSADPTTGYLAGFITMMYIGFPFTVVSQLSTGPMLDRIAPLDKRGYVQGLNSIVMNVGTALAPWMLGLIADGAGTKVAIWCGVGISILAAAVNFPLVFQPGMGPPPKKIEADKRPMKWEDAEVVEKMLKGEYVPSAVREKINDDRVKKNLPFIIAKMGTYEGDKERMAEMKREAFQDFDYLQKRNQYFLAGLAEHRDEAVIAHDLEQVNAALKKVGGEELDELYSDIGQWFADYVRDNGYFAHLHPTLMKQMISSAFPVVMDDKELTPENLEQFLANNERIYAQYVQVADTKEYGLRKLLRGKGTRTLYG